MDRALEKQFAARAVALGKSGDPDALEELTDLLDKPSAQIRRLAVSAIGKLSGLADARHAVDAIEPLLQDAHPQVRQYTIRALSAYGAASRDTLADLRDVAANPSEKEYNRRDAAIAVDTIEEALRIAEQQAEYHCQRCHVRVDSDEYARSQRAFHRVFCDRCFDEVYLQRRNFDTGVELNKTIRTKDGTLVQSEGERRIAEYLHRHNIVYRYDERMRIIEGCAIRRDFYLPEFDLYIEYWGMDTIDYRIGMLKKLKLYQQQGKQLISLYREDKPHLEEVLAQKLKRYLLVEETQLRSDSTGVA